MEVAKIFVASTSGIARNRKRIPAGKTVSGLTVSVEFTDPVWEDMIKTVVFRGTDSRIAEFDGKTAGIPWEVLTEPGVRIWFGIFGHNPDTGMQLPLIEVDIGVTERATDPLADPGTEPTLPIWAQLQEEIEQLKQAGVSEEKIAQIVADYLTKNPPTVSEKDPTVPDWAKNKEKPEYTAQEVGALSQDALDGAVNDALAKAKESGEFDGKDGAPGQNYVLTDADKAEIAEMAADLVDVPEHSGGNAGFVVQDTEPEDTSVLWVDPTDNSEDGFQEAVNAALAQAKASGEFDGKPGKDGADGKDGVVAVTGATVGQTVKISAVDENGVPTAWEPTDFPEGGSGGGSGEWTLVLDTVTDYNQEYQPLTLDFATGVMTFEGGAPTSYPRGLIPNFQPGDDVTEAWKYVPNEFITPAGDIDGKVNNDGTYGGVTSISTGAVNNNVDVNKFHFEKLDGTARTWNGLKCKKLKFEFLAPGSVNFPYNVGIDFKLLLSDGTKVKIFSTYDDVRNPKCLHSAVVECHIIDNKLWVRDTVRKRIITNRSDAKVKYTETLATNGFGQGKQLNNGVDIVGIEKPVIHNQQCGLYNGTVIRIWEG